MTPDVAWEGGRSRRRSERMVPALLAAVNLVRERVWRFKLGYYYSPEG